MSDTMSRDVDAVRRALEEHGNQVRLSLSRETAEFVARVIEARARGDQVLITRRTAAMTPNEAAELLGMSRPQVRKLMDRGLLEFRKVGAHHRILTSSIRSFLDAERTRRGVALEELAGLQNDLGLTD